MCYTAYFGVLGLLLFTLWLCWCFLDYTSLQLGCSPYRLFLKLFSHSQGVDNNVLVCSFQSCISHASYSDFWQEEDTESLSLEGHLTPWTHCSAHNNRCFRCPHSEVSYSSLPCTRSSSMVRTSGESWDKGNVGCGRQFSHLRLTLGVCEEALQSHAERFILEQWVAWVGTLRCPCAVLGDGDEVGWVEVIPGDCISSGLGRWAREWNHHSCAAWYQPWQSRLSFKPCSSGVAECSYERVRESKDHQCSFWNILDH